MNNPLCGRDGASAVYGPQKGATPEMVALLDGALRRFAEIVARDLGKQIADQPGAGAAGGLGAGLIAFLGASLRSGIEIVLEATRFAERCVGADVVFTGEGRLDGQTVQGKTVAGVARAAKQLGRPVVAIGGWIAPDGYILLQHGVDAMLGIAPGPMTIEQLVVDADKLIADAAEQSGRLLRIGEKIGDRLPRCP